MAVLFGIVNATSASASTISSRLTENWSPIGAMAPELPGHISPFISSFEIQAHFTIGETNRALELIRRSWGWYTNHPNGTVSTVIEGYRVSGSFGYRSERGYGNDPSYVSHAHGWSSGPTSALTEYIVGLRVTAPAGLTWTLYPQFGDLKTAEAGFMTKLGKFQAKRELKAGEYAVDFETPASTSGIVGLPTNSTKSKVFIDDNMLIPHNTTLQDKRILVNIKGGRHLIRVTS